MPKDKPLKICIIAEGCYPYVTGGVSGWVQMLITWLNNYSFVIYAIGSKEKSKGKFSYKIPENVVEIKEIFLDETPIKKVDWGKRIGLSKYQRNAWRNLLTGEKADWEVLFTFFKDNKLYNVHSFMASKDFFDILHTAYNEKYSRLPFTEYYWTVISMLLPLLFVINQTVPPADIYHSVSAGYAGVAGSLGKCLYDKPFIMTEHGIYTREREEEIIKSNWVKGDFKNIWIDHFHYLSKCAYDHADKVITLFDRNKKIQIDLGCEKEKIKVIPNGIELTRYNNLPKKNSSDGYINIGAVVRVVPIKDIKTMIQGFAVAKKKYEKIKLYIMGPFEEDMDYFNECKQMIESLSVKDIHFTGRIDITDYIGQMDILLLSSISEGQPLAVLEGMASSKPFIATDVGDCKELLQGIGDDYGSAGIVIPVMEFEKLGQAIVKLCKDKELRTQMGKSALNRVTKLYSKEKLITAYEHIYNHYGG